jgi:hypothetical protein
VTLKNIFPHVHGGIVIKDVKLKWIKDKMDEILK